MKIEAMLATAAAVVMAGAVVSPDAPPSTPVAQTPTAACRVAAGHSVGDASGIAVLTDDGAATLEADGMHRLALPDLLGVARFVATAPGGRLAVVDDLAGADRVVVTSPAGTRVLPGGGEATGVAWAPDGRLAWSVDGLALRLSEVDGAAPVTIAAPPGAVGVYSPVFLPSGSIVAVVEEAPAGAVMSPEGTTLNNLWQYDEQASAWTRLTGFTATGTNWVALRTPVVTASGDIVFTRTDGDAAATVAPLTELWRLRGATATSMGGLPDSAVLAGMLGDDVVINRLDPAVGRWELLRRTADGFLPLGCGAAKIASLASDPDEPATASPVVDVTSPTHALGVAVGDFGSVAAARAVLAGLPEPSAWHVLDAARAPMAVQPGKWIVARRLPSTVDPLVALHDLQAASPALVDRSFVVVLD